MYHIKVVHVSQHLWVWQLRCESNYKIAQSKSSYYTEINAKRWAKYWAKKLKFGLIEFKETS